MSLGEYLSQANREIQPIPNENNEIYEARMNEFCMNYMNKTADEPLVNHGIARPKCSISPINVSSVIDSSISNIEPEKIQNESYLTTSVNYNQFNVSPSLNKVTAIPSISSLFYDSGFQSYHDISNNNNNNSSALLTSTNSPYVPASSSKFRKLTERPSLTHLNPKPTIQFQSTPNKNLNSMDSFIQSMPTAPQNTSRINFRSIDDLAKSSTSSISQEAKPKDEVKVARPLVLKNSNTNDNVSVNFQPNPSIAALPNTNIAFNEQLRMLSQSLYQNKENSQEFLSKIKRKPRTQITKQQREILEYAYSLKSYPDSNEVEYLCHVLGFEENVIRVSIFFYFVRFYSDLINLIFIILDMVPKQES